MSLQFKADLRAFNKALHEAVLTSSRTAAEVINGHAMFVALAAIRNTEKADRNAIAYKLGQIGTKLTWNKRGTKVLKSKSKTMAIRGDSLAARIINKRRLRAKKDPLSGPELEAAITKMIAARQRGVAFIKSGWVWVVRDLWKTVRSKRGAKVPKDVAVKGQPKGSAKPAQGNLRGAASGTVMCIIKNTALIAAGGKYQHSSRSNPMPVAEKGLAAGLREETENMKKHMAEKLRQAMQQQGIPTTP